MLEGSECPDPVIYSTIFVVMLRQSDAGVARASDEDWGVRSKVLMLSALCVQGYPKFPFK
jgi:hypothetical protein